MNHLTALERADHTGWVYGSRNRRAGAYAIGYCAEQGHVHPTEDEARACYGQYQRDRVRLDIATSNWCDCAECGEPTKTGAGIEGDGYNLATLCEKHLTAEFAIKHLHIDGPAGDSWQS